MRAMWTLPLGAVLALCLTPAVRSAQTKAKPTATPQVTKATAVRTTVSKADQRAIIALFKGVDPSLYRLQFNNGKVTAGTKKISMEELAQASKISNPGESHGYVVLVTVDRGVVYILAVTGNKGPEEVLGAEKAAQLNQIMAKYSRAGMH